MINYTDFGRIKKRGIPLTNNQVEIDAALEILLTDKLIEDKNIEYKGKQVDLYSYVIVTIITILLLGALFISEKMIDEHLGPKGSIGIIQCGIFIITITMGIFFSSIRNVVSSIFSNIKKRKKR